MLFKMDGFLFFILNLQYFLFIHGVEGDFEYMSWVKYKKFKCGAFYECKKS